MTINTRPRLAAGALALSAAGLVLIAQSEGWRDTAYVPVPGDRPTIGFGTTAGVRLGDRTEPVRALALLLADASEAERAVQRCAGVPMTPYEFSAFVALTYNIGSGAFCRSSIPPKLRALDYEAACRTILEFDKMTVNGVKRPVRGLTLRRQREFRLCAGESIDD